MIGRRAGNALYEQISEFWAKPKVAVDAGLGANQREVVFAVANHDVAFSKVGNLLLSPAQADSEQDIKPLTRYGEFVVDGKLVQLERWFRLINLFLLLAVSGEPHDFGFADEECLQQVVGLQFSGLDPSSRLAESFEGLTEHLEPIVCCH